MRSWSRSDSCSSCSLWRSGSRFITASISSAISFQPRNTQCLSRPLPPAPVSKRSSNSLLLSKLRLAAKLLRQVRQIFFDGRLIADDESSYQSKCRVIDLTVFRDADGGARSIGGRRYFVSPDSAKHRLVHYLSLEPLWDFHGGGLDLHRIS